MIAIFACFIRRVSQVGTPGTILSAMALPGARAALPGASVSQALEYIFTLIKPQRFHSATTLEIDAWRSTEHDLHALFGAASANATDFP
jgi:hypothetical protein